jgi:DnaA family protein
MQQTFGPTRQRLVATAQAAPHQLINRLREDLRTRLSQGLVFELHELDDQEKLQALRERAFRLGWMSAPIASDYDHLFGYMLARLPRQLGRLMRLLEALDARALALKRPVSLPLMRSLLEENLALF